MKFIRIAFFTTLLFSLINSEACKKQNKSTLYCNIHYCRKDTVPEAAMDSSGGGITDFYTGYGSYITSITPTVFKGKFNRIVFQNDWGQGTVATMELIGSNADFEAPERYADFSKNAIVEFKPKISMANQTLVTRKELDFIYFYWSIFYFYHEITLPSNYSGIQLEQFHTVFNYSGSSSDTAQHGLNLKTDHFPFMDRLFGTPPGGLPWTYVFGNTDSSFVFNANCQTVGPSKDNPTVGNTSSPIIRSNKYNAFHFIYSETEDMHLSATAAFDFLDLIQIYAGRDNIPYTKDDIFLYAPKFWERLTVKVNTP